MAKELFVSEMLEQWDHYTQNVAARVTQKHDAITRLNEESAARSLEKWQTAKADQDAQNAANAQAYQQALRAYAALPWYRRWMSAKPREPVPVCGLALFNPHHFTYMEPDEKPTLEGFFTWLARQVRHTKDEEEEEFVTEKIHGTNSRIGMV